MDEGNSKRTNGGNWSTIASHRTATEPQCGLKGWSARPLEPQCPPLGPQNQFPRTGQYWEQNGRGTGWGGTESELSEAGDGDKGVSRYTTLGDELWT